MSGSPFVARGNVQKKNRDNRVASVMRGCEVGPKSANVENTMVLNVTLRIEGAVMIPGVRTNERAGAALCRTCAFFIEHVLCRSSYVDHSV